MSLSFWLLSATVVGICVFVFKKTVSNDATNDYRIRDILSRQEDEELSLKKPTPQKEEQIPEPVGACVNKEYENSSAEQSYSYHTNSYSTTAHENTEETEPVEEKVFYEKINDDACENYNKFDEEDLYEDDEYTDEDYTEIDNEKSVHKPILKKRSLFDYVKTFWHGITFTIGILVCLYSFFGIATQVQTSNDAIIYSIWLLIGVVLIK